MSSKSQKIAKSLVFILAIAVLIGLAPFVSPITANASEVADRVGNTRLGSNVQIDGKNWTVLEKRTMNNQEYALLIIYGTDYGRTQFRADGASATLGGNTLQAAMNTAYSQTTEMKTIAVVPNLTAEGWQGVTGPSQTPGIATAPTAAMAGNQTSEIFFALSHNDMDRIELELAHSTVVGAKTNGFWLRCYNLQTFPGSSNIYAMYVTTTSYHQYTSTNSTSGVAPAVWVKYRDNTRATINVYHKDRVSGLDLKPVTTHSVNPGNYGPYNPETFANYAFPALAPGSDPASGTIASGQTRNITYLYEPVRTVSGQVWPMLADDLWGNGSSFIAKHDVVVELRPTFRTPASPGLSTKAVLRNSTGLGDFTIANVPYGNYVLYIKRPGYLARAMLVTVSASSPSVIALSPPGIGEGGVFRLWWGDCNDDGRIDNEDILMILELLGMGVNAYHPYYNAHCDLNGDGRVDNEDIQMVLEMWNRMMLQYPGSEGVDPFS